MIVYHPRWWERVDPERDRVVPRFGFRLWPFELEVLWLSIGFGHGWVYRGGNLYFGWSIEIGRLHVGWLPVRQTPWRWIGIPHQEKPGLKIDWDYNRLWPRRGSP